MGVSVCGLFAPVLGCRIARVSLRHVGLGRKMHASLLPVLPPLLTHSLPYLRTPTPTYTSNSPPPKNHAAQNKSTARLQPTTDSPPFYPPRLPPCSCSPS